MDADEGRAAVAAEHKIAQAAVPSTEARPTFLPGFCTRLAVMAAHSTPMKENTATPAAMPIVLFSLWITFVSGYQAVYDALVVVLVGVILYVFLTARREDVGQIPEPVDNPPDDTSATSAEAPATAGYAPVAAGQPPAPAGSNE